MLKILPPTLSGASEQEKGAVYRGINSLKAQFPDGTVVLIPGDYLELKFAFPGRTERIKLLDETFEETLRELKKLLRTPMMREQLCRLFRNGDKSKGQ